MNTFAYAYAYAYGQMDDKGDLGGRSGNYATCCWDRDIC